MTIIALGFGPSTKKQDSQIQVPAPANNAESTCLAKELFCLAVKSYLVLRKPLVNDFTKPLLQQSFWRERGLYSQLSIAVTQAPSRHYIYYELLTVAAVPQYED